jgi:preprotein translocase subunit SecF
LIFASAFTDEPVEASLPSLSAPSDQFEKAQKVIFKVDSYEEPKVFCAWSEISEPNRLLGSYDCESTKSICMSENGDRLKCNMRSMRKRLRSVEQTSQERTRDTGKTRERQIEQTRQSAARNDVGPDSAKVVRDNDQDKAKRIDHMATVSRSAATMN